MKSGYRYWFTIIAMIVVIIVGSSCLSCNYFSSLQNGSPKGIILISADTLGARHVGTYGYERETTPNIDQWAKGAIVFEGAYAPLPGTLPSHMSMLTGRYPIEHGVYPSQDQPLALSHDISTLAEYLQDAGYRTAGFTEGGYVAGLYGFSRGFDEFEDGIASWPNVLRYANLFLRTVDSKDRFFLFLHTYQVHDPYRPPTAFKELFRTREELLPFGPSGANLVKINQGKLSVSAEDVADLEALHDAEIRFFDHRFPDLLATLDECGLRHRSFIVLTADHGEEFMEHGRLVHEQIYEPTVRVPLIMEVPGWQGRERVPELVELVDLVATILNWADVPLPSGCGGSDLLMLAAQEGESEDSWAYCESFVTRERALVYRHDGRELKLIVRGPSKLEDQEVVLSGTNILVTRNQFSRIRIRSNTLPLTAKVYTPDGLSESWSLSSEWREEEVESDNTGIMIATAETAENGRLTGTPPVFSQPTVNVQSVKSELLLFTDVRLFDLNADPGEHTDLSTHEPKLAIQLSSELNRRLDQQQQIAQPLPITLPDHQRARLKLLGYLE